MAVDSQSSRKWCYVRKDFERIPATEEIPEHWRWQETKLPKEAMAIYDHVVEHDTALDDVYAALTELAEMVAGEE